MGAQSPEEKTKIKICASNVVPTSRNPPSVREEGKDPSCSLGVETTVHPLPSRESRGATCTSKVTARYWQLVDLPGMDEKRRSKRPAVFRNASLYRREKPEVFGNASPSYHNNLGNVHSVTYEQLQITSLHDVPS